MNCQPIKTQRTRLSSQTRLVEANWKASAVTADAPPDSFDRVLSTLFFHHLTSVDKRRTASEVLRVLKPGGELHVADWGQPSDPLMWALFGLVRLGVGIEQTRDNVAGALPQIFEGAGLEGAAQTDRLRTLFGTLALYRARKPLGDAPTLRR